MKLDKFNTFIEKISEEPELKTLIKSSDIYYLHNKKWFNKDNNEETGSVANFCKSALSSNSYYMPKKHLKCYFPIKELDVVVACEFDKRPKTPKKVKVREAINRCVISSEEAYKASHDVSTGLYNRDAFEVLALKAIDTASEINVESSISQDLAKSFQSIYLIYLDLDYFKQVNDNFGHLFGNLVLKVLAIRLENMLQVITNNNPSISNYLLSRLGGEEFAIMIIGSLPNEEIINTCEGILDCIRKYPVPTDTEISEIDNIANINIPALVDRYIHASIGYTVLRSPRLDDFDEIKKVLITMNEEADKALYSAKNGGRNRARQFAEILKSGGRVLQHHEGTDILVIDIGKDVGVKVGQEYSVYHPDFTGEKKFVQNDGRSSKTLGIYPKIEYARVIVIDAQSEISFCRFSKSPSSIIPSGAVLEFIPTGSISHLLNSETSYPGIIQGSVLDTVQTANKFIRSIIEDNRSGLFIAVFSIRDVEKKEEELGSSMINQFLARMYIVLKDQLPLNRVICQYSNSTFAMVCNEIDFSRGLDIDSLRDMIVDKCDQLISIDVGIYERDELDYPVSDIDETKALLLAQYANLSARYINDTDGIIYFNPAVANTIIYNLRSNNQYEQAKNDHKKFDEIGIKTHALYNQIGLVYLEDQAVDYDAAITLFKKAINLDSSRGIYHANLGLALFEANIFSEAFDSFENARRSQENFILPDNYLSEYLKSAEAKATDNPDLVDNSYIDELEVRINNNSDISVFEKNLLLARIGRINHQIIRI